MKITEKSKETLSFSCVPVGWAFKIPAKEGVRVSTPDHFGIKCKPVKSIIADRTFNAFNIESAEFMSVDDDTLVVPLPMAEFVF